MMIAGHNFVDTHVGRACVLLKPGPPGSSEQVTCFRRWVDIRNTTMADLDKPDIAHAGNTNRSEIEQIMQERAREDMVIRDATLTAAGFGIGGMAAGAEIVQEDVFP